MKKSLLIISLTLLLACYSNRALMTSDEFASIPIGATTQEVQKDFGKPYAIRSRGGNTDEWEYIERIDVGSEAILQNHYYLIITNGRVVGKHTESTRPPPFQSTDTTDPFPHNS